MYQAQTSASVTPIGLAEVAGCPPPSHHPGYEVVDWFYFGLCTRLVYEIRELRFLVLKACICPVFKEQGADSIPEARAVFARAEDSEAADKGNARVREDALSSRRDGMHSAVETGFRGGRGRGAGSAVAAPPRREAAGGGVGVRWVRASPGTGPRLQPARECV